MATKPYIELLAPAGGPEQFHAALAAGADAIYCGVGNDFNARRSADNFDYNNFEACVREAHLAGARVYVTLNVLVRDDELGRAMALVRSCAVRGADAFIIQDWGLLALIHKAWPELELHVSTQANIHDVEGLRWASAQGAKRVTLSRELSLVEIAQISKVTQELDVDLEVFGHGALCFCYSGLCLLSSMMGGRSANRGLCAQPCRLLYELVDEAGRQLNAPERTRPLCPKDACTAADIDAMLAAGVGALKIEGRMKASDYVYNVVDAYRAQIDSVYAVASKEPISAGSEAELLGATPVPCAIAHQLKRAFNRDFTDAYLHATSGDELMSYERSNNRGELVGEVVFCIGGQEQRRDGKGNLHKDPRQNKHRAICTARIRLSEPVGAGDLLELRDEHDYNNFLTATAPEDAAVGDVIECKLSRPMPAGSAVRVIRSKAAHSATDAALSQEYPRKRKVAVRIKARLGEPFVVELTCVDGHRDALAAYGGSWPSAKAEGFVVEPARTKAVSVDDLIEHVGRMGTSPFEAVSFEIELDEGTGMGFSAVHKVRAAACKALEQAILMPWSDRKFAKTPESLVPSEPKEVGISDSLKANQEIGAADTVFGSPEICVLASSAKVAQTALAAGANRMYAPVDTLDDSWPAQAIPVLDEVWRSPDYVRFSGQTKAQVSKGSSIALGSVAQLAQAKQMGAAFEIRSTIPVHNAHTLTLMEREGAQTIWLSPELSLAEIEELSAVAHVPLGIMVYGRPRVMTSEHCVLQAAKHCIHDCEHCKLRAQAEVKGISLKTKDGKLLPVRTDVNGRSRLYGPEALDLIPEVGKLASSHTIRYFGIDATLLTPEQTCAVVERLRFALENPEAKLTREAGATSGHLCDPIG